MFNNFMTSNINFKGILVSKTNLANNTLALYNLTPDDKNFIKSLQKSIDLPKLYPNLTLHQYGIWNNIICQGLGEYCNNETSTVLLTSNKTPCGVLNYSSTPKQYEINYIATWPEAYNKRVPFAGKTLFTELFQRFLSTKAHVIELTALKYSPFNPIGKYLELGFKMYGGNHIEEIMRIDRKTVQRAFERLKELVTLQPVKNSPNINLEKTLRLIG